MMVTLVSQCEKKALQKTRRVLDAFANRIGDNTWQTLITQDGLNAVKKLLRTTASKNTAVSCHWIRSRSRSELLWVVGQKNKFNPQGIVPVNVTETSADQFFDKHHWSTIDTISAAAQIAGLFHDFGKANTLFQNKIDPDKPTPSFEPYRHEWVSLRLFQAFVGNHNDQQWLEALDELNVDDINSCFRDGVDQGFGKHPILSLPPFAQLVAWIIVSHHRLPLAPVWASNVIQPRLDKVEEWLKEDFDACWNSYRCKDDDQKERVADNWSFSEKALPYHSCKWRMHASTIAFKALEKLPLWHNDSADYLNDHLFTSHLARLCMMLADRYYSSQPEITTQWRGRGYSVYANTYGKEDTRQGFKQQLDEHLIGVAYNSREIVNALLRLNHSLPDLSDIPFLTNKVSKKYRKAFGWQDNTVKLAKKLGSDSVKHGFFGVNMASTGRGKTLANAKIMFALGQDAGRTRFSVALGLRTLTLQTGRAFKKDLDLNDEDLAIAVGGAAIKQLFDHAETQANITQKPSTGSESSDERLNDESYVHYVGDTSHSLSEWTKQDPRIDKLLYAPALVCTIDHLVPATEGTRGGRQTAAMLRLLTSDLILDEPDDFGLDDLPALCRLVHWAGMLGSRVLLSTATLPPALTYALFESYRHGWQQYAKANILDWKGDICCAWFDEFGTSDAKHCLVTDLQQYKLQHRQFVDHRVKQLAEQSGDGCQHKQRGSIVQLGHDSATDPAKAMASVIHAQMTELHRHHLISQQNKCISIGLVRMANIDPLVRVAKHLIAMDAPAMKNPQDTCVHVCVYHSRYPLAIRNHIEQHLDTTLNRKNPDDIWETDVVSRLLEQHPQSHHIFVVLASPVAEVGRDHDYDWAIVEPSSMRSIIQLAGRVLRHREVAPSCPNVILLNQNYKALDKKEICFNRPGFESPDLRLASHHLDGKDGLLDTGQYQSITAMPRITLPDSKAYAPQDGRYTNLNSLEHKALAEQLFSGKNKAKVWWDSDQTIKPYWCGEVQRQQPFRKSTTDEAYYLWRDDEYTTPYWRRLNEEARPPKWGDAPTIKPAKTLTQGQGMYFWLDQSPETIYRTLCDDLNMDLPEVSRRFGEVRVTVYEIASQAEYEYHNQIGFYRQG